MPRKILIIIFVFLLPLWQFLATKVKATVTACTVSVSPTSIVKSSSGRLYFTINNTDSVSFVWIKITSPGSDFTVTGGSSTGWSASTTSSTVTYTSGSLVAGSNAQFLVDTSTGSSSTSALTWTVQASDSGSGTSPFTCSGSPQVTVSNTPPDEVAPTLSSITLSDITSSSVKISWNTNENATSVVNYGTSDSYGSTKSDTSRVTSHSLDITGLSANTTYHYQIKSVDSTGNTGEFGDATFVTAKTGETITKEIKVTTTKTETKLIKDTSAPTVSLTTDFKKTYPQAPQISGAASDDVGVTSVEYSTDGGKNWLPVDKLSSIGAKSATFSFIPLGLDDGTYKIQARVTDPSGNRSVSRTYELTLDRLPPIVGGVVYSLGAQVLSPARGVLTLLAGTEYKITLSAAGGPTVIDITVEKRGEPDLRQQFSLVKNPDSGLWSGILSFQKPGEYPLIARSIDGADNHTERIVGVAMVLNPGQVRYEEQSIDGATITVFVKDPTLGSFAVWNGAPYGIANPQKTTTTGNFSLNLPQGTYYIEIAKTGYQSIKTQVFHLKQSTPVINTFQLKSGRVLRLGNWILPLPQLFSLFTTDKIELTLLLQDENTLLKPKYLIDKEVPAFIIESETKALTSLDLRGKPTVISLITSWQPETGSQLVEFERLAQETEINLVPVFIQSPPAFASLYKARGGYKLPFYTDRDGLLVEPLGITTLPTHLFLSRRGVVKNITTGVLTSGEIVSKIVK